MQAPRRRIGALHVTQVISSATRYTLRPTPLWAVGQCLSTRASVQTTGLASQKSSHLQRAPCHCMYKVEYHQWSAVRVVDTSTVLRHLLALSDLGSSYQGLIIHHLQPVFRLSYAGRILSDGSAVSHRDIAKYFSIPNHPGIDNRCQR
jgi:hypothetical protein